jgi:MarR family transcriptional regulator, lower aerobic nicotinate degradation pathway regulator
MYHRHMTDPAKSDAGIDRATDRPGDTSPFAIGLLARRAHRRAATALATVMRPYGLELRHFAVLIVLVDRGATLQRELPQLTGFDKAAIGRAVDDLEDIGFVKRVDVPHDRRIWRLEITARGVAVFDQAHVDAQSIEAGLVAHLAPGEPEHLLDLLTRYTYPDAAP